MPDYSVDGGLGSKGSVQGHAMRPALAAAPLNHAGWRTFLRNHTAHIAAVDLFIVPTIGFKMLYGLVILRPERRRLVWFNVTANPAEWIARQITEAFP
jgi:hypothetical protein